MIPEDALVNASQVCLDAGVRILEGFRLAPTDRGHVAALLELMDPRTDTVWADIGCGFGEVARLMSEQRPDLGFVLINSNQFQLDYAPRRFLQLRADMHDIPLPDACVDGCMFLYSLCHADGMGTALWEAARITRAGGALFVFDYERVSGDNTLMTDRLFARAYAFERVRTIASNADWTINLHANPRGDDQVFRQLYGDVAEYDLIFRELQPVVWKAVRQ
jgi:ubiquinone/menaquinone biosynthesis C-methylase UbiE